MCTDFLVGSGSPAAASTERRHTSTWKELHHCFSRLLPSGTARTLFSTVVALLPMTWCSTLKICTHSKQYLCPNFMEPVNVTLCGNNRVKLRILRWEVILDDVGEPQMPTTLGHGLCPQEGAEGALARTYRGENHGKMGQGDP